MAPFDTAIDDFICQCPYFFERAAAGWHIDINTMSRTLMMGGPTWHFISLAHPYMFAFKDYILKMNRYYPDQGQKAFLGITYPLFDKTQIPFKISPEWDSPAKEAGILNDDILISIDGIEITEAYQDWEMMKHYRPGDKVEVLVKRNGRKKRISVTLQAPKSHLDVFPYVRNPGDPWTGFYFAYSQPYERKIEDVQLSVIDVAANSPAERAGFRAGDLIYAVPGSRDRHVGLFDYHNMLKKKRPGEKANLMMLRNLKERLQLEVEIGSYTEGKPGI
jgi:C-terminal processing protease CtpA/Prc